MRVMFLPLKCIAYVSVLFLDIETGIILLFLGLLMIVIPKGDSIIDVIITSGYMKSTAGIIYRVRNEDVESALANGYRKLTVPQTFFLKGKFPEYKE